METIERSGATSEDLLQLTEKRAVAGEPLTDPTLPLEPGTAFTGGKGGFTCPQWPWTERVRKLARGSG